MRPRIKLLSAILAAILVVVMGSADGLNPELMRRFQALQAAARQAGTSIGIGSGTRSIQEQASLRIKNGCPDVWSSPASSCRVPTAIPGRSNHNHGLAIDITGDKGWANANAARFGLHFPVAGEDWHIEMIDDDGSRGFVQGASQMGAIGFDLNWMEEGKTPEEQQDELLGSLMDVITGAQQDALLETPSDPALQPPVSAELGTPSVTGGTLAPPGAEKQQQLTMEKTTVPGQAGAPGGGAFKGNVPPPGYVPQGEGVERWRPIAIAALNYTGQDPGLADLLLMQMRTESGGDPMARNDTDINAQRGDPSKGLMQNIGSAFPERARELAGRGVYDGFANIVASIRYTLGRYGSLQAGWKGHGY